MSHIHWVVRRTGTTRDKDEVNKWEIHKCDGRAHDADTMVDPLTPKPTPKAEAPVRAPSTIVSRREEGVAMRHCHRTVPRDAFLKQKQKSEAPQRKTRTHVTTQISMSHPPHPNHTHTYHTNALDERVIQRWCPPTDTQSDTQSRSPRQGTVDHCLTSRRRRYIEEVTIATVLLYELYSWHRSESPGPTYQP